MKAEGMTKDQLIEELARVRQEIADITHSLNNTLVGVLGNISLAKMYRVRDGAEDEVIRHLESAEKTFLAIRVLADRMFGIAEDGHSDTEE